MAATSFSLLFLMSVLTGSVGDLLDAIPTDQYWQNKKVQVTEVAIAAELAPPGAAGDISKLIDDLGDEQAEKRDSAARKIRAMGPAVVPQLKEAIGSGNPEVAARARRLIKDVQTLGKSAEVRKLMAIRTAGEEKMVSLLPRLKELSKSEEPFVADYAAAAVVAIEAKASGLRGNVKGDKPYVRSRPNGLDEAYLLPADTRLIYHLTVSGRTQPLTLASILEQVKTFNEAEANGDKNLDEAANKIKEVIEQVIGVAEQTGNIRIDGITVGVSGNIGNAGPQAVVLVNGRYDPKAVSETLAGLTKAQPKAFAGISGLELPDGYGTALFPNDHHAVLIGGPKGVPQPVDELAAALKSGKGPLKEVPEMAGLLGKVDASGPMWGVVSISEAMRQAPLFKSIDQLIITSKLKGDGMSFQFDAKGPNGAGVADAVNMVNQGVQMARTEMKRDAEHMPGAMRPMIQIYSKLMETIKCSADEKDPTHATLTGEFEASPMKLMGGYVGMMLSFTSRIEPMPAQAVPAPPAPAPNPPPAPPQQVDPAIGK